MAARFQRRQVPDERVGDILSDSNSEISSIDNDEGDGAGRRRSLSMVQQKKRAIRTAEPEGDSGSDKEEEEEEEEEVEMEEDDQHTGDTLAEMPVAAKVHQRPIPRQTIKRKNSKWYDSDDDDDWDHVASDSDKIMATERARSRSVPAALAEQQQPPPVKAETVLSADAHPHHTVLSPDNHATPTSTTAAGTKQPLDAHGKRSSFQRLVGKTFNLSPFGSKRKQLDAAMASPASSGPDTPRTGVNTPPPSKPMVDPVARIRSPLSDVSSMGDSMSERRLGRGRGRTRKTSHDPNGVLSDQTNGSDVVSPQSVRTINSPAVADSTNGSRRRPTTIQSPGGGDDTPSSGQGLRRGSDYPVSSTTATSDALSPSQRKVPGAFPGRSDSGVLLEGWLRQKQRRGVKGMKKWNSRYFVLYAKTNEVRYYADVVQSAWGPIPLGEIGCISLRLIQRIGKPGTLKYKGCRLDITCRNTWGTHYADDYVSSDDENTSVTNNANNVNSNDGDANANTNANPKGIRSSEKTNTTANSTPKSSRVYSLMADSPQTAGAWFTMLDSLLVRSAISPRVDMAPSTSSTSSTKQSKRLGRGETAATPATVTKMTTRRRSSTLDMETMVVCGPQDYVPKPVLFAINFIFDSSPGIETEKFYEMEPDAARLKAALTFLNQFATDATRKPTKDELEQVLDAVTAGAVVKRWLTQLEQPLVPFELYAEFRTLAADARAAPFELTRHLKALVRALPPRHFAMVACVLFHLNDVNVYASKNGMDAATLATLFGDFIVRPRAASNNQDDTESERQLLRIVVEEMIAHVDGIIDEKEAEILDRV